MEDPLLDTATALQPFLDLIEDDSNVSTVRAIILKVFSHPEIFNGFDQLASKISSSNINDAALLKTLELFSYGTYGDYQQNPSLYLPLNDSQVHKLKQLTVLSQVQQACLQGQAYIPYEDLGNILGATDKRQMEQVMITGLYARIWNGQLCQRSQHFILGPVPPCIARDVPVSSIPNLLASLRGLANRLDDADGTLETAQGSVTSKLEKDQQFWKSVQDRKKKVESQAASNSGGTVRVAGWPGASDVARRSSTSRQSKRSRGGLGGSYTEAFQRF